MTSEQAADLIKRFTGNTSGMSTRRAAALARVSHTLVAEWKAWAKDGADPAKLRMPAPASVEGVEGYLRVAMEVEARRQALRIAADRLEGVARELRQEAKEPGAGATSPPSGDAKPAVFAKEGAKTKKKPGGKLATGDA